MGDPKDDGFFIPEYELSHVQSHVIDLKVIRFDDNTFIIIVVV
jgi:hypothetical protein